MALKLNPGLMDSAMNMIVSLREVGQREEAKEIEDQLIAQGWNPSIANANRLFNLYFEPNQDGRSIYREHAQWNKKFAAPLHGSMPPPGNDRSGTRRLKIGYVSPDFHRHCQAFFTIPLLSNHDRAAFEIYCYSSVIERDENTRRIQQHADVWRDCLGKSDAEVAAMVRADGIDILVDLTQHMANGRPLLFARKPAPIQVAWLAYPGTTGQTAIDYRLTDPYLDPPGQGDENYSEKSVRLADTFWCYDPLGASRPSIRCRRYCAAMSRLDV